MQPLLRLSSHISPHLKRLYYHSKCAIQSANVHEKSAMDVVLIRKHSNRQQLGVNGDAISKVRNQSRASSKYVKVRGKLQSCQTIKAIDKIINSRDDFDISVYTAAIKRAGRLQDIKYCIKLFHTALREKRLTPNVYIYCTLFNAFNLNLSPLSITDRFLDQMVNVHNIKPNEVTATILLGGCSKVGDVERAQKIWDIMLKCNIKPDQIAYVNMIVTCGQGGAWKEAQRYYNEMESRGVEINPAVNGAMLHAFIKNNKIEEALSLKAQVESEGKILGLGSYIPLISYYLRDAAHQNPSEALRLLNECVLKHKMTQLNAVLLSIKHVALLKALQNEKQPEKRKQFFEIIRDAPKERLANGLTEWDYSIASVVHGAHLAYFDHDFECTEVIECFEKLCEMNMMGYWFFDKKMSRWMIDLHGYSYEQLDFVLHYLLNIKAEQLVESMGYTWIFICGKRQSVAADAKDTQTGAKRYIVEKLWNEFQIKSSSVNENKGRIILNRKHIARYLGKKKENATLDSSAIPLQE